MDAWTKNKLFNLIWDMTCSPHAMRVALFETINVTPAPHCGKSWTGPMTARRASGS